VAIKILPPSRAKDPGLLARFQREVGLACRLEHPNVVRAFEAGEANGLHYLVMEYLEGETLQEVLEKRGRLTLTEAAHVVYQALLGLQHLFENGIVHRNLEPANLMVVRSGNGPLEMSLLSATVKLLDISLSRSLFDEPTTGTTDNLRLTHEEEVLGNPDYLAPEQARDAHSADIRADIYGLGCILYHALTGVPPFSDSSVLGQTIRHATETPRPLTEVNPQVPGALQLIVDWMMAKDPGQRYPTPTRAAEALHLFLAEQNAPDSLPYDEMTPQAARDSVPPIADGAADELDFVAIDLSENRAVVRKQSLRAGKRDYLMLMAGALGLLVAEFLGWVLAHLLHGKG
jgi:serine/threonine protein kinase